MSDVVVISGMSGAGRTQAGNSLEDLGWFVIDNLPAELIPKVAELAGGPRSETSKVALVVGAVNDYGEVSAALNQLRASGSTVRVVFLDASTDVLVRRYESTKRRHPKASPVDLLVDAIERERSALREVRESADLVIDTSNTTIYELRARVEQLFSGELASSMTTTVMSFGFKYGVPGDVDLVIDCRFLPNPFWIDELRAMSGHDQPVIDYLFKQPVTSEFLDRLDNLLELLVPAYRAEGKAYLTIAMGCTGGRHRSVAMAEEIRDRLERFDVRARVIHRDIDK